MIVHKKGFPVSRRTTIGNPFLLYRKYNVPLKYENCVSYRVKSPSCKDALWERDPGILVFAGSVFFQKFIDSLIWI